MLNDLHQYVLLADSTGKTLKADLHGKMPYLSWEEALPFLTRPELQSSINIWFAFGYDINMLAKWESKEFQEKLYREGGQQWVDYMSNDGTRYQLKYIPRKILRIKKGGDKHAQWVYYDSWGFFQGSFEKALKEWKIEVPEIIHEGKGRRGEFTISDFDDGYVERYNAEELKLLVRLMDALYVKLEAVKLIPSGWHGAGAIASKLLSESKCRLKFKPHMFRKLDDWQRFAYFGGRVELVKRGEFDKVYSYDINSAYPASTLTMPDITGNWESVDGTDLQPDDFALVEVSWDFPECRVGPLPFRLETGYVLFPSHGRGIYHNVEAQAALTYMRRWHADRQWTLKFGKALRLKRPYSYPLQEYVDRRAKQRLAYKKVKDFAHIPIKLGLNALYGKFAQRPQYVGHKPIYRQLLVAGYITAHTRAELLLKCEPESVILFATDSIKSLTRLSVTEGEDLGQWEPDLWDSALFLMAGIYAYKDETGWHNKTRGLHELDMRKAYAAQEFIGAGKDVTVEAGFESIDQQFMGIKRSLANYKAYPEPCRFYPLHKLIDWNQNNKREKWTRDGNSWPMSEFEERHSSIYQVKFDQSDLDDVVDA